MHGTRRRDADATTGTNGSSPDVSAATRFEVLERAGEGTLWVVYRVRDKNSGLIYALRALKSTFARHVRFAPALGTALQSTIGWNHPRLSATYEVGQEENTLYAVSDWLPGQSLEVRLRRAPFNRSEALEFLRQIAEGLDYLHAKGQPHGDLRPRQIIVGGDGLKLTDVAAARAFHEAGLSLTDVVGDAAFYAAPERWDNRPPSAGADLYALGVILYRMLTGRVPFDGPSPLAIAMRHRRDAPLRPSQLNPQCSADLERIALRLLEKEPQDRYVSVAHLLRDLSPGGAPDASAPATSSTLNNLPPAAAPTVIAPASSAVASSTVASSTTTPDTASWDAATQPLPLAPTAPAPTTPVVTAAPAASRRGSAMAPVLGSNDAIDEEEIVLEEKKARKKHRRREAIGALLAIFWTLVAAGLLGGIFYGAYYFWVADLPKQVKVPEYRYQNQFEAERALSRSGLRFRVAREVFDPKRESGTVLSGDPPPGKNVRVGREISATVSRGPEPIRMYDFTELTLQQARQIAMRDGLRLGNITDQYHDTVPAGYICGQYPDPGESFRRSEPINFVVSKGPLPSGDTPAMPVAPPAPTVTPQTSDDQPGYSNQNNVPDVTLVSRAVRVQVTIPSGGTRQEVRVIVRDAEGERTVYRQTHDPGELIDETVPITRQQGTTATVRIYVGGSLLREERI